jgi:iron complex outermembrane receptor protein
MNYGTSLGKKKSFINATSFQLRGQTGRAKMQQEISLMPTML